MAPKDYAGNRSVHSVEILAIAIYRLGSLLLSTLILNLGIRRSRRKWSDSQSNTRALPE